MLEIEFVEHEGLALNIFWKRNSHLQTLFLLACDVPDLFSLLNISNRRQLRMLVSLHLRSKLLLIWSSKVFVNSTISGAEFDSVDGIIGGQHANLWICTVFEEMCVCVGGVSVCVFYIYLYVSPLYNDQLESWSCRIPWTTSRTRTVRRMQAFTPCVWVWRRW